MISYNGKYYVIKDFSVEHDLKKCSFSATIHKNSFDAERVVDYEEMLFFSYKGDDYFLPSSGTLSSGEYVSEFEAKLYDDLNNGFEFVGLQLGKKVLQQEVRLGKKRRGIRDEIGKRVDYKIRYGFQFSLAPEAKFDATLEWQFDVQNLVMSRDNLTYPYKLKINTSSHGKPIYITLVSADVLALMYSEFFTFVSTLLYTAREEKNGLVALSEKELDSYVIKFK